MTRRGKRGNGIELDLTGYDPDGSDFGGGGGFHIPEGDYPVKLESVEQQTSKSSDKEMLVWVFIGTGGKAKGKKFYHYTSFSDPQKIGKTIMALGGEPESGKYTLNPDDLIDSECMGEVYTDEYNGEKRSKLRRVFVNGEAEVEEEEEEEKPRGRANGKTNGKSKVTKLSEDEVKELGEDELEDLLSKHELEVDLSAAKTLSKKRNLVIEALAENNLIA